jgi:tRNA-dihydrouridine synthase 2
VGFLIEDKLLYSLSLLFKILENLVKNSGKPVTCKIRILDSVESTVELVRRLVQTGIRALAVHCRRTNERPRDPGHWDYFRPIVDAVEGRIPIIANGDFRTLEDARTMMRESGVSSVMFARWAQFNVSVFREEGLLHPREIMITILKRALRYDTVFANTKFTLQAMMSENPPKFVKDSDVIRSARDYAALCKHFGVDEEEARKVPVVEHGESGSLKRPREDDGEDYQVVKRDADGNENDIQQQQTTTWDETLYEGGR